MNNVLDLIKACALRFFKVTGKACGKICIYYKGYTLKKIHKGIIYDVYVNFFSDFLYKSVLWVVICLSNSNGYQQHKPL